MRKTIETTLIITATAITITITFFNFKAFDKRQYVKRHTHETTEITPHPTKITLNGHTYIHDPNCPCKGTPK